MDSAHPLHQAATRGDLQSVDALISANPDMVFSIDNEGDTALHCAAFAGKREVAELLLARNAQIDAKDSDGLTALHAAVRNGHQNVVELLLARNADRSIMDNTCQTPLNTALAQAYTGIAQLLLTGKASIPSTVEKPVGILTLGWLQIAGGSFLILRSLWWVALPNQLTLIPGVGYYKEETPYGLILFFLALGVWEIILGNGLRTFRGWALTFMSAWLGLWTVIFVLAALFGAGITGWLWALITAAVLLYFLIVKGERGAIAENLVPEARADFEGGRMILTAEDKATLSSGLCPNCDAYNAWGKGQGSSRRCEVCGQEYPTEAFGW